MRILFYSVIVITLIGAACSPKKSAPMATLSIAVENLTKNGETIDSMRFPQSGENMYWGWVAPNGGGRINEGINVPVPHDRIVVTLYRDKDNTRREIPLELVGMGQVNSIGRIEYHLEINDQGMRVVPPKEWPKPGETPVRPPPTTRYDPPGLLPPQINETKP